MYMLCFFFVKNLILHANSYKDPSHYKVQLHGFFSAEKRFYITFLFFCRNFTCVSGFVSCTIGISFVVILKFWFACLQ